MRSGKRRRRWAAEEGGGGRDESRRLCGDGGVSAIGAGEPELRSWERKVPVAAAATESARGVIGWSRINYLFIYLFIMDKAKIITFLFGLFRIILLGY